MLNCRLLVPCVALLACGCTHEAPSANEATAAPSTDVPPVARPDTESRTSLGLIHDSHRFALGDSYDDLMTVYGRPRSAFQFDDLPPGFQSPYAAKGWETAKEGVGAILYGGKVVAVMRQLTRATPELLQEIVDTIEKDNPSVPPKSVQGNHVVYYFLDQGNQRIMISALSTKHDGLHITEALGEDTVMNALDMNPAQATVDKAQVDALVDKVKN